MMGGLSSFQSSGYRVVLLLGKLRPQVPSHNNNNNTHGSAGKKSSTSVAQSHLSHLTGGGGSQSPSSVMGFIGVAIALPPPSVHEVRLESDMFVTRLGFDFKIAHCEPK